MSHLAVIGTQWGDEGKGKIVDRLAQRQTVKTVVRYQGGSNAGHTVVVKGEKHAFHLLPSGILYPGKTCVIASGVIIDPEVLLGEIKLLESRVGKRHSRLLISDKCHLIMPWHKLLDGISGGKIGTTGRGIGPTYSDYVARRGIRVMDLVDKNRFSRRVNEEAGWNRGLVALAMKLAKVKGRVELKPEKIVNDYWHNWQKISRNRLVKINNVAEWLSRLEAEGGRIIFEGAQATLLDVMHGTYPFVTSSNPTLGGLYLGSGFRPKNLKVVGVVKAYTTRVGAGPFPTELFDQVGGRLREVGHEFGTTTGRPRRCGWLDTTIINYAKLVNGLEAIALTKLDVLTGIKRLKISVAYQLQGETLKVFPGDTEKLKKVKVVHQEFDGWQEDISQVRRFGDLPKPAQNYISTIERLTGLPVALIGVGPERNQIIIKERL